MPRTVEFAAELWEYGGQSSWVFLSLPADLSEDVKAEAAGRVRGFGSLRVSATLGGTTWSTSVFPSAAGPYLLPVKKAVRRAEDVEPGDHVDVVLELLDL